MTLLVGYDVESADPEITRAFLRKAEEIHRALEAPGTMFFVGKTLIKSIESCQNLAKYELFDIQQHTYSHVLLKTSSYGDSG